MIEPFGFSLSVAVSPLTSKLMLLFVLTAAADIFLGYMTAKLRKEAQSNRLREGILKRTYILIILFLLVIFTNIVPGATTIEIGGTQFSIPDLSTIGFILAEFKSIMEKANKLGLENHPVIRFIDAVIGAPYRRFFNNNGKERDKDGEKMDPESD